MPDWRHCHSSHSVGGTGHLPCWRLLSVPHWSAANWWHQDWASMRLKRTVRFYFVVVFSCAFLTLLVGCDRNGILPVKQVCSVQPLSTHLSTWHCPHMLLSAGTCCRLLSPARRALSSKLTTLCCSQLMWLTYGQMLDHFIDPSLHAPPALPVPVIVKGFFLH